MLRHLLLRVRIFTITLNNIYMNFKKDNLAISISDSRLVMGQTAAKEAAEYINKVLEKSAEMNIIFAAAPSQDTFLASLITHDVEWGKINAFHMDEYIGLAADAPQRFGNYLNEHIFSRVPLKSVNYLSGSDAETAMATYRFLWSGTTPLVTFMGIGENGHIAFNDPHVALFNDSEYIKVVTLDDTSRMQQVHDGCFLSFEDVPATALTLTIPALMSSQRIFCVVPGKNKANAVKETVQGEIVEKCPASILRTHDSATLYCDRDSAQYLLK